MASRTTSAAVITRPGRRRWPTAMARPSPGHCAQPRYLTSLHQPSIAVGKIDAFLFLFARKLFHCLLHLFSQSLVSGQFLWKTRGGSALSCLVLRLKVTGCRLHPKASTNSATDRAGWSWGTTSSRLGGNPDTSGLSVQRAKWHRILPRSVLARNSTRSIPARIYGPFMRQARPCAPTVGWCRCG